MAEIFRVEDPDAPERKLALKLIRADRSREREFRQMLIDEAKIASRLDHPNIARVLEMHEAEGELGLILEYVAGIDLIRAQQVIREQDLPMSIGSAVLMLTEVLDGLHYAHNVVDDAGDPLHVVHRDVSPGNIMLDLEGRARIIDWGIARAKNRIANTDVGHVKGKFRYMAPEQITGKEFGPQVDVYSAAVSFWEVLAGQRIYDDVELPKLMLRVSKGDLPSLREARSDIPRGLAAVFKKATARDPKRRYPTAAAFATDLRRLGLISDENRARAHLARMVLTARLDDHREHYEQAVESARSAAGDVRELEGALLRALQSPDRVERIDAGANTMQAEAIDRGRMHRI